MSEENKIPEINIKLTQIDVKAKSIKLKGWRALNRNGINLLTKHKVIYLWYKFWWWIKPPKIKCYVDPSVIEYFKNFEKSEKI